MPGLDLFLQHRADIGYDAAHVNSFFVKLQLAGIDFR